MILTTPSSCQEETHHTHAVHNFALQRHAQRLVERKNAPLQELSVVGHYLGRRQLCTDVEVRRFITDTLGSVVAADVDQSTGIVPCLFCQLALSCLLQRLSLF